MRTLRHVLGAPLGLPSYRWMLELGAIAIRTETELVLKSRWVVPERLQQAGYRFLHPELEPALRQILKPRGSAHERD
jgi:NAD dependent epimerase/dehydratase family enzyme